MDRTDRERYGREVHQAMDALLKRMRATRPKQPPTLVVERWDGEKWVATRQEWNEATGRYEIAKGAK